MGIHRQMSAEHMVGAPGERHVEALADDGAEVEDARVQIDGAQRAAGDDDGLEFGEHGLHGQRRVQARQLDDRVRNRRHALIERLRNDLRTSTIACSERAGKSKS